MNHFKEAPDPNDQEKRPIDKAILRDFVTCLKEWFNVTIKEIADRAHLPHRRLSNLMYRPQTDFIYQKEIDALVLAWQSFEEDPDCDVAVEKTGFVDDAYALINDHGLTNADLATITGVSCARINRTLLGQIGYVSPNMLAKLKNAHTEAGEDKLPYGKYEINRTGLRELLQLIRNKHGLTVREIENRIGLSPQRLTQLCSVPRCKNIRRNEIEKLKALCAELGEEMPDIITSKGAE